jgi:rubrerythrin
MSGETQPTLAAFDRDGALGEAVCGLQGQSRASFLRTAALGSGALLALFAAPARGATGKQDVEILNFALVLEELQAAFYSEVERIGSLKGQLKRQATVVGAHERAHVEALRGVLAGKAVSRPRFDFRGATESPGAFRKTAVAFEDLAVAAYKGQAPRIESREYLASALAIHAVEARHAAWIRRLANVSPVLEAFDEPQGRAAVLRTVKATNFIATTRSRRSPRYTG